MSKLKLKPALCLTLAGLFMLAAYRAAPAPLAIASPTANSSTPAASGTPTVTLAPSPIPQPTAVAAYSLQPIDPK
jgi:hypothetical protein